jgi:malonyl-CoA O-methyltransferase
MKFDARAPEYARHARPQAVMVAALARTLPAGAGAEALELGAGTGLLTRELVRLGYRVTATDSAPGMIAEGARGVPGAAWEKRDAWAPGVACCDRLFSANLLQWAADPVAVLRAHRAALRPGGVMAHVVFTEPTLRELREVAGPVSPLTWRSAEAWLAAATAAGLRVRRSEGVEVRAHYADARALLHALHGTGAVSGKAVFGPGALRRVLREYDRRFATGAGGVYATWAGVCFEADVA